LEVWAQRDGVDIVTGPESSDPAAVVFDAVTKAKRDHYDVLLLILPAACKIRLI